MNLILTILSSHLLSVIENALIADEPEIVAAIEKEIELLITKLESFLQNKSSSVAPVVVPILNKVNALADTSRELSAGTLINSLTPQGLS